MRAQTAACGPPRSCPEDDDRMFRAGVGHRHHDDAVGGVGSLHPRTDAPRGTGAVLGARGM